MTTRLVASAICLAAALVLCRPFTSGATRVEGKYIGRPFGPCRFTTLDGSVVASWEGDTVHINGARQLALKSAGLGSSSMRHESSPVYNIWGHEADVYVEEAGSGKVVFLNSYNLWIASKSSNEDKLMSLGGTVAFLGPPSGVVLLLLATLLGVGGWLYQVTQKIIQWSLRLLQVVRIGHRS